MWFQQINQFFKGSSGNMIGILSANVALLFGFLPAILSLTKNNNNTYLSISAYEFLLGTEILGLRYVWIVVAFFSSIVCAILLSACGWYSCVFTLLLANCFYCVGMLWVVYKVVTDPEYLKQSTAKRCEQECEKRWRDIVRQTDSVSKNRLRGYFILRKLVTLYRNVIRKRANISKHNFWLDRIEAEIKLLTADDKGEELVKVHRLLLLLFTKIMEITGQDVIQLSCGEEYGVAQRDASYLSNLVRMLYYKLVVNDQYSFIYEKLEGKPSYTMLSKYTRKIVNKERQEEFLLYALIYNFRQRLSRDGMITVQMLTNVLIVYYRMLKEYSNNAVIMAIKCYYEEIVDDWTPNENYETYASALAKYFDKCKKTKYYTVQLSAFFWHCYRAYQTRKKDVVSKIISITSDSSYSDHKKQRAFLVFVISLIREGNVASASEYLFELNKWISNTETAKDWYRRNHSWIPEIEAGEDSSERKFHEIIEDVVQSYVQLGADADDPDIRKNMAIIILVMLYSATGKNNSVEAICNQYAKEVEIIAKELKNRDTALTISTIEEGVRFFKKSTDNRYNNEIYHNKLFF